MDRMGIVGGLLLGLGILLLVQIAVGMPVVDNLLCSSPPGVTEPAECGSVENVVIGFSFISLILGFVTLAWNEM